LPRAATQYLPDPTDGLSARVVGPWSREKHHVLSQYLGIFGPSMRHKWSHRAYVDLFAGPGVCVDSDAHNFFVGSPLLALAQPFTDHVYVDLDPTATNALAKRVAARGVDRKVTIITGDCNALIDQVIEALPKRDCLAFAFIDPSNWEISYETIRRLVEGRRVDLLVTFHAQNMKRASTVAEQPRLDAFFGTKSWRTGKAVPTLAEMVGCYTKQLASLGYLERATARDIKVTKSAANQSLKYLMPFYSKSDLGYDFFDKVTSEDHDGQLTWVRQDLTPKRKRPGP
jgi:three-Cys-motif partner protein